MLSIGKLLLILKGFDNILDGEEMLCFPKIESTYFQQEGVVSFFRIGNISNNYFFCTDQWRRSFSLGSLT